MPTTLTTVNSFIYLASQSPRRRQLLEQLGVAYQLLLPDADEVTVEVTPRAGKRPEVRATHRQSGQSVAIAPAAGTADVEWHARELLAAEMARQARLHAGVAPQEVVRRWWLGARPTVRDPRTGVTVSRLKDLFQGDIDLFLLAHLERRRAGDGKAPATSAVGG